MKSNFQDLAEKKEWLLKTVLLISAKKRKRYILTSENNNLINIVWNESLQDTKSSENKWLYFHVGQNNGGSKELGGGQSFLRTSEGILVWMGMLMFQDG